MKSKKIKPVVITAAVILIVMAGAAGVVNGWKNPDHKGSVEKEEEVSSSDIMDETNIGVAADDDPWKEMEQLVKVYYGGDQQVLYSGKMKLFDDTKDEQRLLEEHDFDYSFFRGQYFYKLDAIECVSKEKFILMVNHSDKTIAVSPVQPHQGKQEGLPDMDKFKEMMKGSKADVKLTQTATEKIITVNNLEDPAVQGYQIFYDPVSYEVHKIVIGMIRFSPVDQDETGSDKKQDLKSQDAVANNEIDGYSYKLEIVYEKMSVKAIKEKEFNPENKFIHITGNHIDPAEGYENYQLIN